MGIKLKDKLFSIKNLNQKALSNIAHIIEFVNSLPIETNNEFEDEELIMDFKNCFTTNNNVDIYPNKRVVYSGFENLSENAESYFMGDNPPCIRVAEKRKPGIEKEVCIQFYTSNPNK